jgi:hypothetical protein
MIKNNSNTPEGWLYIGDDKVRYALGQPGIYNLLVVGLNPSTATPDDPDPTIKRIRIIAEKEHYKGWIMINLYPQRTSKPDELSPIIDETIARKNREVIKWIRDNYQIGRIYAAWGTNIEKRGYLPDECQYIVDTLESDQWFRRGITKYGHPKHPLYVSYKEEMQWYPVQDYLWSFR